MELIIAGKRKKPESYKNYKKMCLALQNECVVKNTTHLPIQRNSSYYSRLHMNNEENEEDRNTNVSDRNNPSNKIVCKQKYQ